MGINKWWVGSFYIELLSRPFFLVHKARRFVLYGIRAAHVRVRIHILFPRRGMQTRLSFLGYERNLSTRAVWWMDHRTWRSTWVELQTSHVIGNTVNDLRSFERYVSTIKLGYVVKSTWKSWETRDVWFIGKMFRESVPLELWYSYDVLNINLYRKRREYTDCISFFFVKIEFLFYYFFLIYFCAFFQTQILYSSNIIQKPNLT